MRAQEFKSFLVLKVKLNEYKSSASRKIVPSRYFAKKSANSLFWEEKYHLVILLRKEPTRYFGKISAISLIH